MEAAIVFPLVILSVVTLIYIVINMYTEAILNLKLHERLREEAGRASKTVTYIKDTDDEAGGDLLPGKIKLETAYGIMNGYIYGYAEDTAEAEGIIKRKKKRTYRAEKAIVNEEAFIRKADIVKDII